MRDAGVRVRIGRGKRVSGGGYCRGYFDGEEFVVARHCEDYRGVFLHEYCHFRQYQEDPRWWEEPDLFDVLGKRRMRVSDWCLVVASMECERDCEERVMAMGGDWVDLGEYVLGANANLFFYHYCYLVGRWVGGSGSLHDPRILDVMPGELVCMDRLGWLDMGMMRVYDEVFGS